MFCGHPCMMIEDIPLCFPCFNSLSLHVTIGRSYGVCAGSEFSLCVCVCVCVCVSLEGCSHRDTHNI
jgi:hypothetical protein